MTVSSFGALTDTAGAATQVTADRSIRCCELRFRPASANAGLISIGVAGFTPGGAGMIGELLKPASGYEDQIEVQSEGDTIYPADYWIKPTTNGDKVFVSYLTQ